LLTQLPVVLGVTAGIVQFIGYWIYNKRMGQRINVGSWGIWLVGGTIDLVSYLFVSDGDWVVNVLPAVCALAAIVTFGHALTRKRFGWPDKLEWTFLSLDGLITVLWLMTNALVANVLYQISNVASFVPLTRKLLSGKEQEDSLPWLIWTCAYSLLLMSVLLRLDNWVELAYPASHVAIHLVVFLVAKWKEGPAR
jgi:hypothetical protein